MNGGNISGIGSCGGSGKVGKFGGVPVVSMPNVLEAPLVTLSLTWLLQFEVHVVGMVVPPLLTWLVQVAAVHEKALVVVVEVTPLMLVVVLVIVAEDERFDSHAVPAEHDGRSPAITWSIWASFSG